MSTEVRFSKGAREDLPDERSNGTLYFTSDTGELFDEYNQIGSVISRPYAGYKPQVNARGSVAVGLAPKVAQKCFTVIAYEYQVQDSTKLIKLSVDPTDYPALAEYTSRVEQEATTWAGRFITIPYLATTSGWTNHGTIDQFEYYDHVVESTGSDWIRVKLVADESTFLSGLRKTFSDLADFVNTGLNTTAGDGTRFYRTFYSTAAPDLGTIVLSTESVSIGNSPEATGRATLAVGQKAKALGDYSVAFSASKTLSDFSAAFGQSTAKGQLSFSCGNSKVVASGTSSFAANTGTEASGVSSAAFNYNSKASGNYSFSANKAIVSGESSFGANLSSSTGKASFAANKGTASGEQSFAANNSTASGKQSFAIGDRSQAQAGTSFAGGYRSIASGANSFAFGGACEASYSESVSFGQSNKTTNISQFLCGDRVNTSDLVADTVVDGYVTSVGTRFAVGSGYKYNDNGTDRGYLRTCFATGHTQTYINSVNTKIDSQSVQINSDSVQINSDSVQICGELEAKDSEGAYQNIRGNYGYFQGLVAYDGSHLSINSNLTLKTYSGSSDWAIMTTGAPVPALSTSGGSTKLSEESGNADITITYDKIYVGTKADTLVTINGEVDDGYGVDVIPIQISASNLEASASRTLVTPVVTMDPALCIWTGSQEEYESYMQICHNPQNFLFFIEEDA